MVAKAFTRLNFNWENSIPFLLICLLLILNTYNFLLFHSVAEIFSIVVASGIFLIAWNSRKFIANNYLLMLGIAYLFVGIIDLVHTLSYKGMGIFTGSEANLPTQLWIAARYVESFSLFIAPLSFFKKNLKVEFILSAYSMIIILIFFSIFILHIFPDCYIEGQGLTSFKKVSEYIISFILIGAMLTAFLKKEEFDNHVFNLVIASILLTIFAELAFTFYISVFGFSNLVGHLLKVTSFYLTQLSGFIHGVPKAWITH